MEISVRFGLWTHHLRFSLKLVEVLLGDGVDDIFRIRAECGRGIDIRQAFKGIQIRQLYTESVKQFTDILAARAARLTVPVAVERSMYMTGFLCLSRGHQ